jgi:hypothetical protein
MSGVALPAQVFASVRTARSAPPGYLLLGNIHKTYCKRSGSADAADLNFGGRYKPLLRHACRQALLGPIEPLPMGKPERRSNS